MRIGFAARSIVLMRGTPLLRFIHFYSFAICLSALFIPRLSSADSLEELVKDSEVRFLRKPTTHELLNHSSLAKGSQFRSLFDRDQGSGIQLIDWLAAGATGAKLVKKRPLLHRKLVFSGAEAELIASNQEKLVLTVLVPHPVYAQACEDDMYDEFANLRPPRLRIAYSQPVEVETLKGTLFEQQDGKCSLLLSEPSRSAVVQVVVDSCEQRGVLFDYVKRLDYGRFVRNLGS